MGTYPPAPVPFAARLAKPMPPGIPHTGYCGFHPNFPSRGKRVAEPAVQTSDLPRFPIKTLFRSPKEGRRICDPEHSPRQMGREETRTMFSLGRQRRRTNACRM
ncbi:hypothetical protein BOTBODRAFT_498063 [Botryobasidium botryosum FD-172 SS1]|uniref:Uncharacterized protein n=1 Tax=Botryobasidium botryosum (strain FD-172 SS1) TaxID=930990 RepID=A0A067M431_BOTB1|nr:hypothetical protein BOTBODRAFT_498063 [Botryobasidium botryosum FD-172 SS1]